MSHLFFGGIIDDTFKDKVMLAATCCLHCCPCFSWAGSLGLKDISVEILFICQQNAPLSLCNVSTTNYAYPFIYFHY